VTKHRTELGCSGFRFGRAKHFNPSIDLEHKSWSIEFCYEKDHFAQAVEHYAVKSCSSSPESWRCRRCPVRDTPVNRMRMEDSEGLRLQGRRGVDVRAQIAEANYFIRVDRRLRMLRRSQLYARLKIDSSLFATSRRSPTR
jgi:hypothetical protein